MSATKNNANFEMFFNDANSDNDYGFVNDELTPHEEAMLADHEREVVAQTAIMSQYDGTFGGLFGNDMGAAFDKFKKDAFGGKVVRPDGDKTYSNKMGFGFIGRFGKSAKAALTSFNNNEMLIL